MNYIFDTETYTFGTGNMAPKVVCLTDAVGIHTTSFRAFPDVEPFVGHNVAYDMACLVSSGWLDIADVFAWYDRPAMTGLVRDTMIEAQLRDIADGTYPRKGGYSLAALAGFEKDQDTRVSYEKVDGLPVNAWPAEYVQYARKDVEATASLVTPEPPADALNQARWAWALHLVSCWGLEVDGGAVKRYRAELNRTMDTLRAMLRTGGILDAKGRRSLAAVRARLTAAGVDRRTEKGAQKTGAEDLRASADPALGALADYLEAQKIVSTYLTDLPPIVHPRYGLADSGRTTCYGPNIQNLPRAPGVRECFVPREGMAIISCDYSTLELRTLAQCCLNMFGRSKLADALNDGRDPHLELGARLLGRAYADVVTHRNDPEVKAARSLAKAPNFGFAGGMGAAKLRDYARASYGLDIPAARCKELRDQWLAQWPEMTAYFRWASGMADGSGIVTHFVSGRVRGGCGYCDGANTLFQGLAADAAKAALYDVVKACYIGELSGCRVVAFIHDEILMEAPVEYVHEAAEVLERLMLEALARYTPGVRGAVESVAMDRWSKGAKRLVDEHGRLAVYEVCL